MTTHCALTHSPACPCGSGQNYLVCCEPAHRAPQLRPADAAGLMRSRYSAFVMGAVPYLLATWHPSTRPARLVLEPRRWLGLKIIAARQLNADHATVEFVARSRIAGNAADRLHELSRFRREQELWYYIDGDIKNPRR